MKPHLRQILLQCAATTGLPHISQRGSVPSRAARVPPRLSRPGGPYSGHGPPTTPSCFVPAISADLSL